MKTVSVRNAVLVGLFAVQLPFFVASVGFIVFVKWYTGNPDSILYAFFPLIFVFGWLWWSLAVPIWRIWAYKRVDNISKLKEAAIKAYLIWPDGSAFEKTEIRTRHQKMEIKRLDNEAKVADVEYSLATIADSKTLKSLIVGGGGVVISMATFFIGLAFRDSIEGLVVLVFPISIALMVFFIGYLIHGKIKNALLYLLIAAVPFLFLFFTPSATIYKYECENSKQFTATFADDGLMRVVTDPKNVLKLPPTLTPEGIKTFADDSIAYTFVQGYEGQVIMRDKTQTEPSSTICHLVATNSGM